MDHAQIQQKLDKLNAQAAQLDAQRKRIKAQWDSQQRTENNRRKFVAGAIVLREIEKNEQLRNFFVQSLASSPERDKKLFAELLAAATESPKGSQV